MREVHRLKDEPRALRHLRIKYRRRGKEAVPKPMRLGARYARENGRTAQGNGPNAPDCREALGRNLGAIGSEVDDCFHGKLNSLFSAVKCKAREYEAVEHMMAIL